MNTRHLTCISSYHNRARCCSRYGYHIPSHSEPALCCHDVCVCVCVFSTMTSTMAYSGTSYVIHIVDYNYSSGVLNLLLSLVVILFSYFVLKAWK